MATFRINYSKVISQANTINELARDLNGELSRIENMEREIRMNWEGATSETFLIQTGLLKADINDTYRKTVNLSSTIKNMAIRIQREDEAAVERARRLVHANKK